MRSNKGLALVLFLSGWSWLPAQVLTPFEVKEPAAHRLQERWLAELNTIGAEVQAYQFPYPFYLSRELDIDQSKQLRLDQRSIRFAKYNGQTVLEITGNYYAAYSDVLMDKAARVKKTYEDVVLPILKMAESKFPGDDSFGAFAIEVSHHVRGRVLGGVVTENPENITFILPRAAAHHLVTATTLEQAQAALLDSEVYVDAELFSLWLTGDHPPANAKRKPERAKEIEVASLGAPPVAPEAQPSVSPALMKGSLLPARLITPDMLEKLTATHRDAIARMVANLDPQAHFVSYAPPVFVGFHQGAYLQLSMTTPLPATVGSRYQLAALAFDDHISLLIRPALAHFQQAVDFDGLSFSTTLKLPGGTSPEAVEFFFPFPAMHCYANYDCTGQQLIDSGIVLINGERAGLDLQAAEAVETK